MTGVEYQDKALRTANGLSNKELLVNGVMGMCGEAGECVDMVKKNLFQEHTLDREHMIKELGDVCWYVAITAKALGVTLDDVYEQNIAKLEKRYPNGFEADRSINRQEGDI